MMRFVLGLVLGFVLTVGVPLLLLTMGTFNVAATEEPGAVEMKIVPWLRDRSIHKRAAEQSNPFAQGPTVLPVGMAFYRQSCVMCHGAPDVDVAAFAEGLNPAPPLLEDKEIQSLSDGEIYWVIKSGIRMTGMPAFDDTYEREEMWKIVAYVRHLPKITEEEKEYLGFASETERNRHEGNEASTAEAAHSEGEARTLKD